MARLQFEQEPQPHYIYTYVYTYIYMYITCIYSIAFTVSVPPYRDYIRVYVWGAHPVTSLRSIIPRVDSDSLLSEENSPDIIGIFPLLRNVLK